MKALLAQIDLHPAGGDRINFFGLVLLLYWVLRPAIAE
jgi:hypothetical protein